MNNPYIYVILNGELKMSPGKAAAQVAHALGSLHKEFGINTWSNEVKRTVIILEAKDGEQMDNLWSYLDSLDIPVADYIDEGVNEITPYSTTAMAIGPIEATDEETRSIFAPFPLFPAKPQKRRWFRR